MYFCTVTPRLDLNTIYIAFKVSLYPNTMTRTLYFILIIGLLYSCKNDQLTITELDATLERTLNRASTDGSYTSFILPETGDYNVLLQDPRNRITKEKVALGKFLFYETGLGLDAIQESGKQTYSCASCHIPEKGFMPGRVQGIADGGIGFGEDGEGRTRFHLYQENEMDVQGARPLSLLNSAFVTNSTWAGAFGAGGVNAGTEDVWDNSEMTAINHLGYAGLESQNIEGLHVHRMVVNKEVLDEYNYTPLFDLAFPDMTADDRYSPLAASFAISAYIRTLLPNEAPFQQWLKGDKTAMNELEKEGAVLFFGKAGCVNCHKTAGLNAMEFYAIGVKDLYETGEAFNTDITDKRNLGRGGFTGKDEDLYKFKVPQLYNLKKSPFYFHGSSKRSLREVVEYFNDGIAENANIPDTQISPLFHPLDLDEEEITALTTFLETGLYDNDLDRYVPEFVLSGNCFPNNDILSRAQMGCE